MRGRLGAYPSRGCLGYSLLVLVDLTEHLLEEDLREAQHRVGQRAELMRHAGQELGLVRAGDLELGAALLLRNNRALSSASVDWLAKVSISCTISGFQSLFLRTMRAPTIYPSRSIGTASTDRQPDSCRMRRCASRSTAFSR